MPDLIIKVDSAQQEDLEQTLKGIPMGVGKAQAAAINRTMKHVRAVAARKIKQHINLPIARIKEAIDADKRRATPAKPVGTVRFSHKPVPLIDYGAQDKRPGGVTVTAQRDKGRQTFRHAFIATMPAGKTAGHRGVFERLPGTLHRTIKGNWIGRITDKIKELFGPSVEGTFEKAPGIVNETLADAGPFLAAQLASQVNRLLKREKVVEDQGDD